MPYMATQFYQPQLQAGQLQEQKDVHQLRLAEIAKMNVDIANQQANKEAAQRIFGDTGVQAPPSGPAAQAPTEDQTYLSQIAQQTQLANKQERMGTFLATTGQLKASEDAFKAARDTRKASEDLAVRQQLEHKRKLDQLGSILGPVSDQPSYDNAIKQLQEVNPQFAAQLPKEYNPSTARMVGQLADSTMTRAQQIDKALTAQKAKDAESDRKARLQETHEYHLATRENQAFNRELAGMRLDEQKQARLDRQKKQQDKARKIGKLSDPKEVNRTSDELKQDFSDLDRPTLDRMAEDVRTRQKDLMLADDSLSATDAYDQAYGEISDKVTKTGGTHILGMTFGEKKTYKKGEPAKKAAPTTTAPKAGMIEGGYRFKGGDPSNKDNWEKVK